ncbi:DUF3043 domain-containing protein [Schaalia vaccimaxillae]|uniref:DUF3043 domain-containing protein n=1 Tax=Schaalia vaccimaxillae TaxID=183916 RepID=UPI0003B2FAA1|nr:DUF3043 domain-containing protein [Schaalia vaccimaxillae]
MSDQKKNSEKSSSSTSSAGDPHRKGRPTPTRRQAEARNNRPLIPADRKEAKRQARAKRDEAFQREQLALATGDERYLPLRDKGKVRRFIRDWVDARWSFSEFLLPVMVLFLVVMMAVSLIPNLDATVASYAMVGVTVVMYGLFIIAAIEAFIVWRKVKKRIHETYPKEEIVKGSWYYCFSRMIMARRWRSPKPQVARGEFPGKSSKKS